MSALSDASAELQEIADEYGYEPQSRQLIEEMAELTQAINKFWRKSLDCGFVTLEEVQDVEKEVIGLKKLSDEEEYQHIAEEIADVKICLEQVEYLLQCGSFVDKYIKAKIDRQLERIKESED